MVATGLQYWAVTLPDISLRNSLFIVIRTMMAEKDSFEYLSIVALIAGLLAFVVSLRKRA
jgi:hypothetical protein